MIELVPRTAYGAHALSRRSEICASLRSYRLLDPDHKIILGSQVVFRPAVLWLRRGIAWRLQKRWQLWLPRASPGRAAECCMRRWNRGGVILPEYYDPASCTFHARHVVHGVLRPHCRLLVRRVSQSS